MVLTIWEILVLHYRSKFNGTLAVAQKKILTSDIWSQLLLPPVQCSHLVTRCRETSWCGSQFSNLINHVRELKLHRLYGVTLMWTMSCYWPSNILHRYAPNCWYTYHMTTFVDRRIVVLKLLDLQNLSPHSAFRWPQDVKNVKTKVFQKKRRCPPWAWRHLPLNSDRNSAAAFAGLRSEECGGWIITLATQQACFTWRLL